MIKHLSFFPPVSHLSRWFVELSCLFKSIKTACNKRVASKTGVEIWQLKAVVPGAEPIWVAFDIWEERIQAVGCENSFKNFIHLLCVRLVICLSLEYK